MTPYTELQVTTNFSFLRGASHIEELLTQAALFGYDAIGITDRNSLAGIVRAHLRAKEVGIRPVIGCCLDLTDAPPILVYPTSTEAYSRLCRLLTKGKGRAGKGACSLTWDDLAASSEGLVGILCNEPTTALPDLPTLHRLHETFEDRAYVALTLQRLPNDAVRLQQTETQARTAGLPTVVTGDVLYHTSQRRILQDVLTCIREGCTIDDAGFRRTRSADRALRSPEEMARLFARHPDALARSQEIADRCRFSLDELRYQYPHEIRFPGLTAQQTLERLTWEGAATRYDNAIPDDVARQLRHELALIAQLEYAPYFLTVESIVRYAHSQDILCQGRGSAANSAVCYVLGITSIDPVRTNLLFERFVSLERREPPDIDVDFEHERREEVIQWIYNTYGRDRAALCATVIRYRGRGAVRDVGKALGLTEDVTAALATQIWSWSEEGAAEEQLADLNLNLADRRLRLTLDLSRVLIGFPRHLSQHPGGFVLTEKRLDDLVPIEPASMVDRQVIEWDKDDIDALRFMKVDVLGLGMLGCMRRGFDLLAQHRGLRLDLATIPPEDPATYAMIRKADTLGTFQIESRAQMSMLPRLKPRTFYDLVIQVAIVRPGPIQGDMVHPYLRRRDGLEPVNYPTPELERVLGKTLGVPLFQEQAMQVAIVCAGFTAGEADALRRSMATFKFTGGVHVFRDKMIAGMLANGYTRDFAEQTFSQIEGFGSYGFPESHAASFALIAYASAWLKCHHPDVFCCALLNAQPMGFYAPAQIVHDAQLHGVEVLAVCVNASAWDCTLEPAAGPLLAVRLGLRMAKGLTRTHADAVIEHRGDSYRSVEAVWTRAGVPVAALERLAEADGFQALGLNRRDALWAIRGLSDSRLPLFDNHEEDAGQDRTAETAPGSEPPVALTPMTAGRQVVEDYRSVGLSLRRHPVAFLRADLDRQRIVRCADLARVRDGKRLGVAGIVLVRQRPGSARGVLFVTIEDETGHANLILWPSVFERQRRLILSASMIACHGKVQKEGDVIHVIADRLTDLSALLRSVGARDNAFPLPDGRRDQMRHPGGPDPREAPGQGVRDIHVRDRRLGPGIKVPTRDFR
ncbi:MAG: error-prone DNA polymerase [Acetobacteraceae bacterium]|nr:error-prone DNA polymerase [Acetobacteraceae bacterium]